MLIYLNVSVGIFRYCLYCVFEILHQRAHSKARARCITASAHVSSHKRFCIKRHKASFKLSQYPPRCVPAVCTRHIGTNRGDLWRNSNAFIYSWQHFGPDQAWAQNWPRSVRLCYGWWRYIPGVAPVALGCVPVSHGSAPAIGGRAPVLAGISAASHGSRTQKPRCYTVYEYQGNYFVNL